MGSTSKCIIGRSNKTAPRSSNQFQQLACLAQENQYSQLVIKLLNGSHEYFLPPVPHDVVCRYLRLYGRRLFHEAMHIEIDGLNNHQSRIPNSHFIIEHFQKEHIHPQSTQKMRALRNTYSRLYALYKDIESLFGKDVSEAHLAQVKLEIARKYPQLKFEELYSAYRYYKEGYQAEVSEQLSEIRGYVAPFEDLDRQSEGKGSLSYYHYLQLLELQKLLKTYHAYSNGKYYNDLSTLTDELISFLRQPQLPYGFVFAGQTCFSNVGELLAALKLNQFDEIQQMLDSIRKEIDEMKENAVVDVYAYFNNSVHDSVSHVLPAEYYQKRQANQRAPIYDYLFKLALKGDAGTGKSSLLQRYGDGTFTDCFISTLGVDFKVRTIMVEDKIMKLQVWDMPAQERYRMCCADRTYRGAMGIVVTVEPDCEKSFKNLERWFKEISFNARSNVNVVIALTKCDLYRCNPMGYPLLDLERLKDFADKKGVKVVATSAKDDIGVETLFGHLAADIYESCIEKTQDTSPAAASSSHQSEPVVTVTHADNAAGRCCIC